MISAIPAAFFFGGTPSTPEMLFILLAILLLFGAKRLPEIARSLGRSMEEFRRAARDVTNEIMNADKAPTKPAAPLPPAPAAPLPPPESGAPAPAEPAPEASDEGEADGGPA